MGRGDFEAAFSAFESLAALAPRDARARSGLGAACSALGDVPAACTHMRRAVALDPSSALANYNLGLALLRSGSRAEAVASLEAACELEPGDAEFLGAFGEALASVGDHERAARALTAAVELAPWEATLQFNRANSLADLGETEAAVEGYRRALDCGQDDAAAHLNLGVSLHRLGRWAAARASLEASVAREPNVVASRLLRGLERRLGGGGGAAAATDAEEDAAYAEALFDGYADDFDDSLRSLEYRGPSAVADAVVSACDAAAWRVVLDLGAGTGLLARELRKKEAIPPACDVHANDVSRKMLDRAPEGLYASTTVCDAVRLEETRPGWVGRLDAVLGADVSGYINDLEPLLATAAALLVPGGALVLTIELADADDEAATGALGAVGPSGRYRHDVAGLLDAATALGTYEVRRRPDVVRLRKDEGAPVRGAAVVLHRR